MAEKQVKTEKQVEKKPTTAMVYIPEDPLNDYEQVVEVSINGHVWNVARGVMVEVPIAVAEVLKEAQNIVGDKLGLIRRPYPFMVTNVLSEYKNYINK